ncbi:hypothetical protein OG365_31080 [Streptomyces sp. NBC_00853]|uniref:hypothetical protein n=1 Tax=Streptomyces sp. NBC_00853 TaxID=2903681 RepID=UPI0038732F4B|nr:hypothetical protein OG365_31080 [Streptomyces sp. NBC_00853]
MSSTLTAQNLIDRLSEVDPDTPVCLAINPLFPFRHGIADVIAVQDALGRTTVYVTENGDQQGPVPPEVTVAAGWHEPTEAPRRSRTGIAAQ